MSNAPSMPNQVRDQSGGVIDGGYPYHIADTNTHLIRSGPTILHKMIFNQNGDTDWAAKIYDGVDATGTLIAVCDGNNGGNYEYEAVLKVGLFVQTVFLSSGTAAGDITATYS